MSATQAERTVEINILQNVFWNLGVNGVTEEPAADAEALVGSLKEQSLLVDREKPRELSMPSPSSVPSTILQRKVSAR